MTAPPGPPLTDRRLRFVLGKGGVGKSTVAAAMGLAAARSGARALLVEVAGQHSVSSLFRAGGVEEERETELAPGLFGISVDPERATEEYLSRQLKVRPLVEVLTRSRAFHTFTAAAPGLPELVTVGKIWSMAIDLDAATGRPVWDTVIVDCPATGHGIALLETAGNVAEMASAGPVHDQAARIQEVVSHPAATGIVIVALPEELAVTEAIEAATTLGGQGLPLAATVLNGVRPARFGDDDLPALTALAGAGAGPPAEGARAALRHLEHQRSDAAYRDRLAQGTGLPVIELPRLVRRRIDLEAVGELAGALADGVRDPAGRA